MCWNKRKRFMRAIFKRNGGCGCSNPKSYEVLQPTPIPENTNPTTSGDKDNNHENPNNDNMRIPNSKLIDSVAIEKDSKDPHKDFRDSMLQMIFQRQIFTKTDLQDLLECFLRLNAVCHHQVIVQAFMEICHETFPKKNINTADDSKI
ncbi:transcription repressor OFP8-like [Vigna radiata var. radiata]|uniref:Transcription repressor n=1 Tax=Vigna radiata var. radiata TaxID=3916 RepID=A0A1S3T9D7_VIGRR|nr:transcription repressor OFP8-like [Vigna radiata var. radiata]